MTKLNDAKIYRGGRTARTYRLETEQATLETGNNCIRLLFSMSSKGGGTTDVNAEIGVEGFPQIIEIMAKIDRQRTMSAMAGELAKQIEQQPDLDAKTATVGRESVRRAAQQKFDAAPYGDDDSERFVLQSVAKLITDFEAEGEDTSSKPFNLRMAGN